MWVLRYSSNPLKNRVFSIGVLQASCACHIDQNTAFTIPYQFPFYRDPRWGRTFSSQVGMKKEDVLEDIANADESDDELICGLVSDTKTASSEKENGRDKAYVALSNKFAVAQGLNAKKILDKWVEEGNDMSRSRISLTMLNLRSRQLYDKALLFSEWLESTKHLDFTERDYASRLDLIASVHGLTAAEKYIENIPNSFKGEIIYRILLSIYVSAQEVTKADQLVDKMKTLKLPVSSFVYNQLLILYKKSDMGKIDDLLLLMDKENIKRTRETYRIIIDAKGLSNDIYGMDKVFEMMKANGLKPDAQTQVIMANHYVSSGLFEKAEAILNEMESENPRRNQLDFETLLPLYAALGKPDKVIMLWKICQPNPDMIAYKAVMESLGKLNKIKEAEEVFAEMLKRGRRTHAKYYIPLLNVYGDHRMLSKGIDLVEKMKDAGCFMGPLVCAVLVKLYVEAGEVDKALCVLRNADTEDEVKLYFRSYVLILEEYAKKRDVYCARRIFAMVRKAGYVQQYLQLIETYRNAVRLASGDNGGLVTLLDTFRDREMAESSLEVSI